MKIKISFSILLLMICFSHVSGQEMSINELSNEARNSLEKKGIKIIGIKKPRINIPNSIAKGENIQKIEVSLDIQVQAIKKKNRLENSNQNISEKQEKVTLFMEDFEGSFPGNKWQLQGTPTWGKETWSQYYDFHPRGNSCGWCEFQPGNFTIVFEVVVVAG